MRLLDQLRLWWQIHTGEEETPFDGTAPAWLASLAVHVAALVVLTIATLLLPTEERVVLSASPVEIHDVVPEEFQFKAELPEEIGALSEAADEESRPEAPTLAEESVVVFDVPPTTPVGELQAFEFDERILEGPNLSENLTVKGAGSIGTTGAAGAVDRITMEILRSLEMRPTLVVWLFDQSGSLKGQRDEIVDRFDRIYDELGVIEAAGNPTFDRHRDKPLLTTVASFATNCELLTPRPTDDLGEIKSAVRAISDDPRGVENVFSSVRYVADKLRHYRLKAPRRNVLIVVFTDEAGDDVEQLDPAVELCRKYEMPVYVVGVPAPFGRRDALVKYVDPDPNFDQRPQRVPVHQGPESLLPERLKLYFSGVGASDELIDSGFGPFGLTRLAYETGGNYFSVHPNRQLDRRVGWRETAELSPHLARFFDDRVMRSYRPDYVSVEEYRRLLGENRARAALVTAAAASWTMPMQDPRRQFPKVDEARFARDLSVAQRAAAELEPRINQIVATLRQGESDRPTLTKPRWQAGYDLAMGRALAVKVRTEGYNAMLALAKQGIKFQDERSDTWLLVPSDNIVTGSLLAKEAEAATAYLTRVVREHQGTPWALLAERELSAPLGWEWQERFTNVAARMAESQNANRPPPRDPNAPPRKPLRKPPAL